jgi:hypothetical protein
VVPKEKRNFGRKAQKGPKTNLMRPGKSGSEYFTVSEKGRKGIKLFGVKFIIKSYRFLAQQRKTIN